MASAIIVTDTHFSALGEKLIRKSSALAAQSRRFQAFFSVSSRVCAIIWNAFGSLLPKDAMPEHLLWAFLFLKVYSTEHLNCSITGCDEKTFRKWCWKFVILLSDLKSVSKNHHDSAQVYS